MLNETDIITSIGNTTSFKAAAYLSQYTMLPTIILISAGYVFFLLMFGLAMSNNKGKFIKIILIPTLILILLLVFTIIYPIIPYYTGDWMSSLLK